MSTRGTRWSDVVPLTDRVWASQALRLASTVVLIVLALRNGPLPVWQGPLVVVYVILTGVLSLVVLTRNREATVAALSVSLLLDAVYVQVQHHWLGHGFAVDLAIAALLVCSVLLGSFRTGLKLAAWQSLLMLVTLRAEQTGLIGSGPDGAQTAVLVADLALLWLVVLATGASAAVSERELRRRRYDAEALREFAVELHTATRGIEVVERMLAFVRAETEAGRALVCRRTQDGLQLLDGHGLAPIPADVRRSSALLSGLTPDTSVSLALRLDPVADPWLAAAMPSARRLIAVRLDASSSETGAFLVMEHAGQRGARVEQRIVTTVGHAAVTASLALSRAVLLEQAQRAATVDGLTGVLNRRSFDEEIERLTAPLEGRPRAVAMVMVDIDHFKRINDTHGHQVGDQVLRSVARSLSEVGATEGAVIARYGGEEFAVLLPDANLRRATEVADRMRRSLHSLVGRVPVTASFGVSATPENASTATELIRRADAGLYQAKHAGRDRVAVSDIGPDGMRPADGALPAIDGPTHGGGAGHESHARVGAARTGVVPQL